MNSKKAVDVAIAIMVSLISVFIIVGLSFALKYEFTTWGEVKYHKCDQIKDTNLYVCEKIK